LEFRILGPLEVEAGGRLVALGATKQRALLALLLLEANHVVSRDRLIDALWGEHHPETAPNALQGYISGLRKTLGADRIETRSPGYLLHATPDDLDLSRFERLRVQARDLEPPAAAQLLREALALWRGAPLADLDAAPFARVERLRLDELRLSVIEQRIEADLALGEHAELVPELETLVREHPLREPLRGQLMLALYRSGRQAEALEVYRQGRRLLSDELGLEPGEALKGLERAILEHDPALASSPPARPTQHRRMVPTGTVTFLFTDIEGSTALLRTLGAERYHELLLEQQQILRAGVKAAGGHEIDNQGDAFFFAFARAKDALLAAIDGQRQLTAQQWPQGVEVRVRMGLDTGEPTVGQDRYVGLGVHRAARIMGTGHGGQILLSGTTRDLVQDDLPTDISLLDLGEQRLKDLERPAHLYQLVAPGLPKVFPPLRTLPAGPVARRMKSRLIFALATLAVAAIAGGLSVGLGGSGGGILVRANSLGLIDPKTNRVIGQIGVGVRPDSVAVGQGAVWVGNEVDKTLSRIDPRSRAVARAIPLGASPTGVAAGYGAVWMAEGPAGWLERVDPTLNAVTKTFRSLTGSVRVTSTGAGSVTIGGGAVWVAFGTSAVARIDPPTNRLIADTYAGRGPAAIAYGDGIVWIANQGDNTVSRFSTTTNRTVFTVTVGRAPSGVAVGGGSVWVTDREDNAVSRVDPQSDSSTTIPVGRAPVGIAYGAGAVWVANSGDGTVSRIDPASGMVRTIRVGGSPVAVCVGDGLVWVAVESS
jgi:YVTN family beta-propeller protein